MRTNRLMAVLEDCPSSPEWRMPSLWVRMSTATKREALASQSVFLGEVSSVESEVRQVVT